MCRKYYENYIKSVRIDSNGNVTSVSPRRKEEVGRASSYVFTRKEHYINIEEGRFADITFTIDKDDKVIDSNGKEYYSGISLAVAEILNIMPVEGKYRMLLIKED
mgnify:CR=1 FL=1